MYEAYEFQRMGIGFAVDQDHLRPDVAIPAVFEHTRQRVIVTAGRQR